MVRMTSSLIAQSPTPSLFSYAQESVLTEHIFPQGRLKPWACFPTVLGTAEVTLLLQSAARLQLQIYFCGFRNHIRCSDKLSLSIATLEPWHLPSVVVVTRALAWLNLSNTELPPDRHRRGPRCQELGEEGDYT